MRFSSVNASRVLTLPLPVPGWSQHQLRDAVFQTRAFLLLVSPRKQIPHIEEVFGHSLARFGCISLRDRGIDALVKRQGVLYRDHLGSEFNQLVKGLVNHGKEHAAHPAAGGMEDDLVKFQIVLAEEVVVPGVLLHRLHFVAQSGTLPGRGTTRSPCRQLRFHDDSCLNQFIERNTAQQDEELEWLAQQTAGAVVDVSPVAHSLRDNADSLQDLQRLSKRRAADVKLVRQLTLDRK